jgi:hypothetical protein
MLMQKPLHPLALALVVAGNLSAQCPAILNCPPGNPVICDLSGNDVALWNDAPYTWSQLLSTSDLYEGTVDLNLKVLKCGLGNAGSINISYALLFDLDNDDTYESAVSSNVLPPPGLVFANNAQNQNYSGGDPVEFDRRPVPDSLKFRFAIELHSVGDTVFAYVRWLTGNLYVQPRLPEGRHRIIWRVEQGGVVKYCDHTFRVKDCLEPTISCKSGTGAGMNTNGTATLPLLDALEYVVDNSTPFNQLQLSMRKTGNGSGFPLQNGSPVAQLNYDCDDLGAQSIEIWAKDKLGNVKSCATTISIDDDNGYCLLAPQICARKYWGDSSTIEGVKFSMVWVDTAEQLHTISLPPGPDACTLLDTLPPAPSFSLFAEKDTFPLNGVSTFDLVLISSHILDIAPFDAPWKWIAADINRSGTITTFDVLELRKLILGIYNKFPANTSWRFFAANCNFPPNPFTGYCAAEHSFITMPVWNYPGPILFNGVKTGDVNGTAFTSNLSAGAVEARGPAMTIDMADRILEAGTVVEAPIQIQADASWLGFQAGFRFDPSAVTVDGLSSAILPDFDDQAFAQPEPGLLNISWFAGRPIHLSEGDNLLTLRLRVAQRCTLSQVLDFYPERLQPEAYLAGGTVHPLVIQYYTPDKTIVGAPQPNPTKGGVSIPVRTAQPAPLHVEICDLQGRVAYAGDFPAGPVSQTLDVPASAFPDPGVYFWRVFSGYSFQSGKIIRL